MALSLSSQKEPRPHVVIIPFPLPGHSNPMLQFSKQLASLGVIVSFVSVDRHIKQLQEEGHAARVGIESAMDFRLVGMGDNFPEDKEDFQAWMQMEDRLVICLQDVISRMSSKSGLDSGFGPAPCCIISDLFAGWTQDVANQFNIPRHALFTSGVGVLSFFLWIPTLLLEKHLPLTPSTRNVHLSIPGLPPLHPQDLLAELQLEDAEALRFKFTAHQATRLTEADIIFVNTFEQMEQQAFESIRSEILGTQRVKVRRALAVGPLLLAEKAATSIIKNEKAQGGYEEWLDTQSPSSVLYVAFGSMATLSAEQIHELALGLEASEQPFLWVLRPPDSATARAGQANPSVSEYLPPGFEMRTKGRGLVVPGWVSQLRVLSHPSTGGFLTHCGWNSLLESLCVGCPLLAWPIQAEQRMNCRNLVDVLKIALEFKRRPDGVVEKEEVERVVRELMTGEEGMAIRTRAGKLKDCAHEDMAEDGSSTKNLLAFVEELKSQLVQTKTLQEE